MVNIIDKISLVMIPNEHQYFVKAENSMARKIHLRWEDSNEPHSRPTNWGIRIMNWSQYKEDDREKILTDGILVIPCFG